MHVFNIAQALLYICNYRSRKFTPDDLEARLAYLAEPHTMQGCPCAPSLFIANAMVSGTFSKGVALPNAASRGDVPESLRTDVADQAAAIFQSAHDELLQSLLNGKLAVRGREVRRPKTFRLENGALASIEYLPGRGPLIYLDVIPAAEFAELRFIDREGIEAVPVDFPAREFRRWRDLSLIADDVRRLWPIETPIWGRKRGPAPMLTKAVKEKMQLYDQAKLRAMKESDMEKTFGASAATCRLARRSVLAQS